MFESEEEELEREVDIVDTLDELELFDVDGDVGTDIEEFRDELVKNAPGDLGIFVGLGQEDEHPVLVNVKSLGPLRLEVVEEKRLLGRIPVERSPIALVLTSVLVVDVDIVFERVLLESDLILETEVEIVVVDAAAFPGRLLRYVTMFRSGAALANTFLEKG